MGRAAILTYHSLDETGSVISIRPEVFRRQMESLAANSIKVVPLQQIRQHPEAVAITFDDGFANFADQAVPVLRQLNFPATVFVISGYCGQKNNWPTQPPGVPQLPLMGWRALRDLPEQILLGAHTITHSDLRTLSDSEIAREVLESRIEIEQQTGRPVETFAYPYGGVDARAESVIRREFHSGCGTRLDFVHPESDSAVLPRLDAYYLKSTLWFQRPFGISNALYIALRRTLREARSWKVNR